MHINNNILNSGFATKVEVVVSKLLMAQSLDCDTSTRRNETFDIAIAIDFGTDGLGVAYALPNDTKIHVHDKWKSKHYGTIIKPKTIILLNDHFEVANVGLDAKHTYINLKKLSDKWMLFERFKMSLFEEVIDEDHKDDKNDETKQKKIGIKNELIAKNGKKCSSETVFVAAFKHIYDDCKKYLRKHKIKLEDGNIKWMITVPAIWNDEAKNKMKKWAEKAGIIDKKLNNFCKIVYEPDCASLAIQYYMKDKLSVQYDADKKKKKKKKKKKNKKNDQGETVDDAKNDTQTVQLHEAEETDDYKLENGDKYILVDVGGGTADIACHEIVDEFGVKEIYHPSGGKWGSTYIDDQYIELLENIFSKEWIDEFKKIAANAYVNMIYNFQTAKETFKGNESQNHNVELPLEFSSFLESKLSEENKDEDCIEKFVEKAKVFNMDNLIKYDDGYLEMSYIVWAKLFDYVINPLTNHIHYLLTNIPSLMSKHLKYICLVGGLSCSPYFRKRIKKEFGLRSKYKLDLIIPHKPILSVVQGAAFLGITPNFMRARRLQKTYGVVVDKPKRLATRDEVSDEFIEQNEYEHKGKWYVTNCVSIIAERNEEVQLYANEKKTKLFSRLHNKQLSIHYIIICSDMDEPKTIEDGRIIGEMVIHFEKDLKDNDIMSEFIFSETMLEVYAWPKDTPNKRYQVEVKYNDDD